MSQRRVPRAEEVGAETDHVACARQVERRQLIPAEAQLVRPPQHRVVENLEGDRSRSPQPAQELRHQLLTLAPPWARDERDLRGPGSGHDGVEPIDQLLQCLVPGDLGELSAAPFAAPPHRRDEAIGVIRHLHRRLAPYAQLALAERMFRVALELLHQSHAGDAGLPLPEHLGIAVHDARRDAASRGAQRADARFPDRDPGCDLLVRNEADDLVLRAAATGQRGTGAGDGSDLEESTAIHGGVGARRDQ